MSNVICSCTLGHYARVRQQLSKKLHNEIEEIYGPEEDDTVPSDLYEIELKCCRKEFFENATGEPLQIGDMVILESDGGEDFGVVYSAGRIARKKFKLKGLERRKEPLDKIIRLATDEDKATQKNTLEREPDIRRLCQEKVERHNLALKLVDIDLRFDQQKVTVFYTATHRIDFRSLVRDLASDFHARIQMVQITTREEARRANSFGACGCSLCCSSWMQKIHANPFSEKQEMFESQHQHQSDNAHNMIGQCNRPKCCLSYQKPDKPQNRRQQRQKKEEWPPVGSKVNTPDGTAIIESIEFGKKEIHLRFPETNEQKTLGLNEFKALFVKKKK